MLVQENVTEEISLGSGGKPLLSRQYRRLKTFQQIGMQLPAIHLKTNIVYLIAIANLCIIAKIVDLYRLRAYGPNIYYQLGFQRRLLTDIPPRACNRPTVGLVLPKHAKLSLKAQVQGPVCNTLLSSDESIESLQYQQTVRRLGNSCISLFIFHCLCNASWWNVAKSDT